MVQTSAWFPMRKQEIEKRQNLKSAPKPALYSLWKL
jgi:hypothetical protein